jgi:hypothetical protein
VILGAHHRLEGNTGWRSMAWAMVGTGKEAGIYGMEQFVDGLGKIPVLKSMNGNESMT